MRPDTPAMGSPAALAADTVLDHVLFKLTTTRTRCEVIVCADDISEKLTTGLLKPFIMHIQAAEEQIADGAHIIRLEPRRAYRARGGSLLEDDRFPWFMKGTVERVVRFVASPELLERIIAIDVEILQLEEALRHDIDDGYYDSDKAYQRLDGSVSDLYDGPPSPSARRQMSPVRRSPSPGRRQRKQDSRDGSIPQHDFGEDTSLLARKRRRALEARRTMLRREQGVAFARATAAGFVAREIPALAAFAECFGAMRLREACSKFAALLRRKDDGAVETRALPDVADSVGGQGTVSMVGDEEAEFCDVRSAPGSLSTRSLGILSYGAMNGHSLLPQHRTGSQAAKLGGAHSEDGRMMAGPRSWHYGKPNGYADSETSSYYDLDEGMDGATGRYGSGTELATMEEGPSTSGGDESVGDNSDPVIALPQPACIAASGRSGESSGDSELTDVGGGNSGSVHGAGRQGGRNKTPGVRLPSGHKLEVTIPSPHSPWDRAKGGQRMAPLSAGAHPSGHGLNGEFIMGSPRGERDGQSDGGEPLLRRRSSWPLLPIDGTSGVPDDQRINQRGSLRAEKSPRSGERGRALLRGGPTDSAMEYVNGMDQNQMQRAVNSPEPPLRHGSILTSLVSPSAALHNGQGDMDHMPDSRPGRRREVSPMIVPPISPLLDYRRRQSPLHQRRSTLLVNGVEYVPAHGSETEFPSAYGLSPGGHAQELVNQANQGGAQQKEVPGGSSIKPAQNGVYRSFEVGQSRVEAVDHNGHHSQANGHPVAADGVQATGGFPPGVPGSHSPGQYAYAIRNADGSLSMVPGYQHHAPNQSPYVILPVMNANATSPNMESAEGASPSVLSASDGEGENVFTSEDSPEKNKKSNARRKHAARKALRRVVVIKKVLHVLEDEKNAGAVNGTSNGEPGLDEKHSRQMVEEASAQEGPPAKRTAVGDSRPKLDGADDAMQGLEFQSFSPMEVGNGVPSAREGENAAVETEVKIAPEVTKPLVEEFVLLEIGDRGATNEDHRFLGEEDLRGLEQTACTTGVSVNGEHTETPSGPELAFLEPDVFGGGYHSEERHMQETDFRGPVFPPETELASQQAKTTSEPPAEPDFLEATGGTTVHMRDGDQDLFMHEDGFRETAPKPAVPNFPEDSNFSEALRETKLVRSGVEERQGLQEEELRGPAGVRQEAMPGLGDFLEDQLLVSGLNSQSHFSSGYAIQGVDFEPEPLVFQAKEESLHGKANLPEPEPELWNVAAGGSSDMQGKAWEDNLGGNYRVYGEEGLQEPGVEMMGNGTLVGLGTESERSVQPAPARTAAKGVRQKAAGPVKLPPWGSKMAAQPTRSRSGKVSSEKIVTEAQQRAQERLKMRQMEAAKRRDEEKQKQEEARNQRLNRIASTIEMLDVKGSSRLTSAAPMRRVSSDLTSRRSESPLLGSKLPKSRTVAGQETSPAKTYLRSSSLPSSSRLYAPTIASQLRSTSSIGERGKETPPSLRSRRVSEAAIPPSRVSPPEKRLGSKAPSRQGVRTN